MNLLLVILFLVHGAYERSKFEKEHHTYVIGTDAGTEKAAKKWVMKYRPGFTIYWCLPHDIELERALLYSGQHPEQIWEEDGVKKERDGKKRY